MKVAVVGAGAMGSLFGAMLADAGNEIWLYDIWQEHVQTINQDGLSVESQGKTRLVRLNATTDPYQIGQAELTIIFVKSNQTPSAAKTAQQIAGSDGSVMTLQNGMGNADLIAEIIEPDRILAGTTSHGATMLGAGCIRHAGIGATTIGAWAATEQGRTRAGQIADFFNRAGIETEAVDDVRRVVWNKLLINIGINAITALSGIKNGQILDLEITRELSRAAVEEAMTVARAKEIKIREDAVDVVFKVAEATAVNRSSMGQDVDHKRRTEIAAINGFIVREAQKLDIEAPVNFTLTALIQTLEYHYR
ncbi:MAG: 2-dehydropantoate 2-reductase [Deltaproteobacteria bacterium]|jgi:2-dehydropantoate 2-reductase|nr:2-dehydropantoate 2-reductase [Deltaproteobacteria bacterium]